MTFREAIAAIPYTASQTLATGIVASIMRATGHILYVTGALAESEAENTYVLTDEEVHTELGHAQGHLSGTIAITASAPLSATGKERIIAFVRAVEYAYDEWAEWPANERARNLKDLADRAAALGSFLDLELAGLRSSDPGRTL